MSMQQVLLDILKGIMRSCRRQAGICRCQIVVRMCQLTGVYIWLLAVFVDKRFQLLDSVNTKPGKLHTHMVNILRKTFGVNDARPGLDAGVAFRTGW